MAGICPVFSDTHVLHFGIKLMGIGSTSPIMPLSPYLCYLLQDHLSAQIIGFK